MILDYLKARAVKGIYPFHMPGHKGNTDYFLDIDHVMMDITEVRGADNLRQPEGIIKDVEHKMARAVGAYRSFMLVNGSSAGMIAALLYAAGDGESVVMARNSHVSSCSGLALCGARPVYVWPSVTPYGFAGGISPKDVEAALVKAKDARAVVITSPTYEGICSDIEEIAKIAHSYGALLIVDEAHGSHFGCHPVFPESAINCADIVVQSLHKTMVAPNQAAVMHAGKAVDTSRLKECINLVQTTSPSYITMAMIERCADIMSDPANFERFARTLTSFRASLKVLENIELVDDSIRKSYNVHDIDISKLVFAVKRGSGADIYSILLEQHKLELEMHGLVHAIALTSLADMPEGFSRLYYALRDLDTQLMSADTKVSGFAGLHQSVGRAELACAPRVAQLRPSQKCKLEDAAGKICAVPVTPYPPGIPLLLPGEIIDESAIQHLKRLASQDIMIIGVVDGEVKVVENGHTT